MTTRLTCIKLVNIGKNINHLNKWHSYRYFSKNLKIKKTQVMKEWRSKYDRSEITKDYEVIIPYQNLDISCSCSSGPGGQNANKVATRVEIRIDLNNCYWLPEIVIERLKEREKGRINKNNEFMLVCDTHRTQYDNKKEANKRLTEIIDECCYPERERIQSEKPKEFQEIEKECNIRKRNFKKQNKDIKNRGW
eukprot:316787_1